MLDIIKRLNIMRIIKDAIMCPIIAYIASILLCCAAQNGWLPDITEPIKITPEMFKNTVPAMMTLTPLLMFFNGMCGLYTRPVIEKETVLGAKHTAKEISNNKISDEHELNIKAVHEAGHYVMAQRLGYEIEEAVILPNSEGVGGFVRYKYHSIMSTKELKDRVLILYAGLCAEKLVLGDASTGCMGDENGDLVQAQNCLRAYVMLTNDEISLAGLCNESEQIDKEMIRLSKLWERETMDLLKNYVTQINHVKEELLSQYSERYQIKQNK